MTLKFPVNQIVIIFFCLFGYTSLYAQKSADSSKALNATSNDTLRYPLLDRRADKISNPSRNAFDLKDPSNLKDSVSYDPKTKSYYIYEKIGTRYFRQPTSLTFDEYLRIKSRQMENDYFRNRADAITALNRHSQKPLLKIHEGLFNRLFGNGKIDIRPQGELNIIAGYQGQNIKNPTLPERSRKNGGFDFDMNANLNVIGNIGDKMKLPISYNTLSTFDFENQLKLDFTGGADDIFKKIEVGNTSFSSKATLIPGAQQLFGIKTQLQFGKLFITTVFANQRSQRQSLGMQGGSSSQPFALKADAYEENRHFLVGQYFKKQYNTAMKKLPIITSPVQIMRMEVWVTNRTGTTTDTRDIVGLMDLGENTPYQQSPIINSYGGTYPTNGSNDLYTKLVQDQASRNPALIVNKLSGMGLQPVQDFEKTFARKLDSSQYSYHKQLGFVSLNITLQADEVLAVAYQYAVNGKIYQVGEFSQDVPVDSTSGVQKVLFLKLLKATSPRTRLPIWGLMMKNIYSVGFGQLDRQDFQFNVLYEEPGGGEKRYLPEGDQAGVPLISLVNLDRLNNQNDPQPDGVFDYVEGFTVVSSQSRIIFPVLEPFGKDLEYAFTTNTSLRAKYLYYPLYDTIKAIAQTYANLNRYVFKGTAKSAGGTGDISLNAFNVPQGSVTVTAGGQVLQENIDYTIDYIGGTIRVINEAIKKSGLPINVQFENNSTFGVQQKNFTGLRWDYLVNKKLTIGGTMVKLSERPFFTKTEYGADPISNSMKGLDLSYQSELPRLNKFLDKLPFYTPSGTSSISASGEFAQLKPGHSPQIGAGANGLIYLDDFEGTKASIDLRFPIIGWTLASTPKGARNKSGVEMFPEASLFDNLEYGKNRAKIAWYNIEPVLQDRGNINNPVRGNLDELSDPRVRSVAQQEIFPQRTSDFGQSQLVTFDLSYFPKDKGPYNYDAIDIDPTGKLLNPQKRWGGIMRNIDQTDFETANIEYIDFWMLDPFLKKTNQAGGTLYFNLGNISEDILKDSRRFYENGLPTPSIPSSITTSNWGKIPLNPIQVTQAFSNDPNDRPYQDVGFDGLTDSAETRVRAPYLLSMQQKLGAGSAAYQKVVEDPSSDNFKYYRDDFYSQQNTGILGRYKNINSPQGNSPIATNTSQFASAFTMYPDGEDLNRDNTLNENEEYFQYRIDIKPPNHPSMQIDQNFIVDRKTVTVTLANGTKENELWYQFRVPISKYDTKVGQIPDFKSIRFMRMFMTDFLDSTVLRFGKLELVRNNWRRFNYVIDSLGQYELIDPNGFTTFNVTAVNIEENDKRDPIPYRVPPGIERVQSLSNGGINILQNEQSMSMVLCNLSDGDSRGVFKNLNYDLRQYKKVSMFIHAESLKGQEPIKDGEIYAIIRIGSDFINNFYEIKYPLKVTPFGTTNPDIIWPEINNLDFELQDLINLKTDRNLSNSSPNVMFRKTINGKTYSIMGNPNLGEIRGIMAGIENKNDGDFGKPICTEVWFNELRLSGINENSAWAAVGQVNIQLSDLGTISLAGNLHSKGFGTLEQRVNERYRDDYRQLDFSTNLQLGKLLPKSWGIDIPFFANYSQMASTPQYDPYDKDVLLNEKLRAAGSRRDSIRNESIDFSSIRTYNFTNVRMAPGKKTYLWSPSNFDFSYSFTQTYQHNPLIESNDVRKQQGGLGYTYSNQAKYWEPLKKIIKWKTPYLNFLKNFNVNLKPNLLSSRWDLRRQFGAVRPRNVGGGKFKIPETYDKYFVFDRNYNLRWDLTKSFNVDFKATNNARIDEPFGRIDTQEKKDSLLRNLLKGGRNTIYNQSVDFTYNIPTNVIPLLDWINTNVNYRTTYNWIGASRLAVELGNTIQNSNSKGATAEFNFQQLYNKSKLLSRINEPYISEPLPVDTFHKNNRTNFLGFAKKRLTAKDSLKPAFLVKNKWIQSTFTNNRAVKTIVQMMMAVKRVGANYSEGSSTFIPGYMDSTQHFGQNFSSNAPGLDFIFGRQPDSLWLYRAASKGLMSKDTLFNSLFRQSYDQRFAITASVEPFKDVNIDINLDKTFTKTYSSLFKDTSGVGKFSNLSPYASGGFSISFISFQTLFKKVNPNNLSETFKRFQDNRIILSQRLGSKNPYSNQIGADGYYKGYGRYAQDVLIPAFIAAYTNKDPKTIGLIKSENGNFVKSNPFSGFIPRPNWRLTYNGLTNYPILAKIFTNISLTHGYTSTLGMNSFNSALLFQDRLFLGYPSFVDTISGNFIPYFLVPNISISEQFSPLAGIDFSTKSQISGRFEYRKSRQLSLSLIDYQLSEVRSTEITVSAKYRKRDVKLPFNLKLNLGFKSKDTTKTQHDISFGLNLSFRDDVNTNSRLDQTNATATGGQKVFTIKPTIDYVMSNRVSIQFYFDQRRVTPYISSSAPMVNTRAGLQVRISLAQ